jgi:hypothetical protein
MMNKSMFPKVILLLPLISVASVRLGMAQQPPRTLKETTDWLEEKITVHGRANASGERKLTETVDKIRFDGCALTLRKTTRVDLLLNGQPALGVITDNVSLQLRDVNPSQIEVTSLGDDEYVLLFYTLKKRPKIKVEQRIQRWVNQKLVLNRNETHLVDADQFRFTGKDLVKDVPKAFERVINLCASK